MKNSYFSKEHTQYFIGMLIGLGEAILAVYLTNLLIYSDFGFFTPSPLGMKDTLVFLSSLIGIVAVECYITIGILKLGQVIWHQMRGSSSAQTSQKSK